MDPAMLALLYAGSALASSASGALADKGRFKKLQTQTPNQLNRSEIAGNLGLNQIQNPYEGFQPISNNAVNTFQNQVVPGLVERFTSLGNNQLSSPAFASNLNEAGSGLQQALAAMQAQYGQQQQQNGLSLLNVGQAPQFENYYQPGGHNFLSGLFGGGSQALGQYANYGMQRNQNTQQFNQLKELIGLLNQGGK